MFDPVHTRAIRHRPHAALFAESTKDRDGKALNS